MTNEANDILQAVRPGMHGTLTRAPGQNAIMQLSGQSRRLVLFARSNNHLLLAGTICISACHIQQQPASLAAATLQDKPPKAGLSLAQTYHPTLQAGKESLRIGLESNGHFDEG